MNFYFFSITTDFFDTVDYYFFMIFIKVYVILFISIWFLTVKDWWRYILFILLIHLIFQLVYTILEQQHTTLLTSLKGIIFGVIYIAILYQINKKSSGNLINEINKITFDVVKIFVVGSQEKQMYMQKKHKYEATFSSEHNISNNLILLNKVKVLEGNLQIKSNDFFLKKAKIKNRRLNLFIPILIVFSFLLSIFFRIIPSGIKEIDLALFTVESPFLDLKTFIWLLSQKLFNLSLLLIWFFTCKYIWKYAILVNISITIFQIISIFYNDERRFDENELVQALPIITTVIIILYFLSRLIKYKDKIVLLNEEIENQINQIIDILNSTESKKQQLILQLQELKGNQHRIEEKTYYEKLNKLKRAVQREMK